MIGVELNEGYKAKDIAALLIKNGVIVGTSGDSVLRILPPFIINGKDIARFLEVFGNVAESLV
jgi:acetylornithine/succinyldiaminopimelate/putrescine aminotransferase